MTWLLLGVIGLLLFEVVGLRVKLREQRVAIAAAQEAAAEWEKAYHVAMAVPQAPIILPPREINC